MPGQWQFVARLQQQVPPVYHYPDSNKCSGGGIGLHFGHLEDHPVRCSSVPAKMADCLSKAEFTGCRVLYRRRGLALSIAPAQVNSGAAGVDLPTGAGRGGRSDSWSASHVARW